MLFVGILNLDPRIREAKILMFAHSQIFALAFVLSSILNGNLEFTVIRIFATRIPVSSYNLFLCFLMTTFRGCVTGPLRIQGGNKCFFFFVVGDAATVTVKVIPENSPIPITRIFFVLFWRILAPFFTDSYCFLPLASGGFFNR